MRTDCQFGNLAERPHRLASCGWKDNIKWILGKQSFSVRIGFIWPSCRPALPTNVRLSVVTYRVTNIAFQVAVICQLSVDIVWCHVVIFLKQLHYEYCYILCRMPLAHKCSRSCVECYYCCPAMLMLVEAVVAKSPPVIELHQHRYISVCDTNRRPSAVREPDCLQMEAGYTRDLFLRNPNAIPFYFIIFYDLFIVF